MRLGIVCKVCGGDMYEIEDGVKCDTCGYIIRSNFSEDRSEMITKEERLKELELEYEEFVKTDSGKKWVDNCKSRNNGQVGDCGDYIYDFYPEVLM